jgi:hypothetical protein
MGLPEAKAAYQTLKTELAALTNLFDKYNLLSSMKRYSDTQIKQTSEAIKLAPPPANISELKTYFIQDELFNRYEVDKATGALTKV